MAYIVQLGARENSRNVAKSIQDRAIAEGFSLEIVVMPTRVQLRRVRVSRPGSRRDRYLEKEEWARFNQLVNETLDASCIVANVWSTPFDVKGRYWIRRRDRGEVSRLAARDE